jgi:transposase
MTDPMLLSVEGWMNVRRLRALRDAGGTWAEIGREAGCDWRTAKKYLQATAPAAPPSVARRAGQPRLIDPFTGVIDEWLRRQPRLRASVIHERLVAEHGFSGNYQRVKLYVAEARPRICPRPLDLHRRFEVLPGQQAQVDWGDEGSIETDAGPVHVSSFHMTLSHSRDPFCCFVASQDLTSFWGCHVRAFRHFGGVPAEILYDRTKTVVKRHVGRGQETPLHHEALAMAAHYGFSIRLAAPRRPESKGRVERQVLIVREHVLEGRAFASLAEMDEAFMAWLPLRRAEVHRTHGEVIAVRAARDRAALGPLPGADYVVSERHLRRVGKDCLVSFERSMYSVPWRKVGTSRVVELRVTAERVAIHSVGRDTELLCAHARSRTKGAWVVDDTHWQGLPDGTSSTAADCEVVVAIRDEDRFIASRAQRASIAVARRDLAHYDRVGAA